MRRFRRSQGPRPVIRSFKKVLDFAPASRLAATVLEFDITTGLDSVAVGQTGVADPIVPTGANVKAVHIDFAFSVSSGTSSFFWCSLQRVHSGQSAISPRIVGGNAQRNQVVWQKMFMIGLNQNHNISRWFKIPKKFQRVRDGDQWIFVYESDVAHASGGQMIYKIYL